MIISAYLSVSLFTLWSPYPTVLAVTMTYHQALQRSHSGSTAVKMAAEMNFGGTIAMAGCHGDFMVV
jgi:hypothetical protein